MSPNDSSRALRSARPLLVALALVGAAGSVGCELLVDFDRTRIPVDDGGVDGSIVPVPDASDDASTEAGPAEAGPDASDGGADGGRDAAGEGGDAAADAGDDAADAG